MKKVFMGVSGGLDSGVLAHSLLLQGREVVGVSFGYGQRHGDHEQMASIVLNQWFQDAGKFTRERRLLTGLISLRSSRLMENCGESLPEGHYADPVMKQTVVPGRNLLFVAALASMAEAAGGGEVVLGVHAGDCEIYPDCRPGFLEAINGAVQYSSENKVRVVAPFLEMSKKDIVAVGLANKFPFHLTRTCYSHHETACGRCGACQERLEAFALNGAADPLDYTTRDLIPRT